MVISESALALIRQLQAEGFHFAVEGDRLRIRPADRVSLELQAELRRAKPELLVLLGRCDADVLARLDAFRQQLEVTPAPRCPAFLFRQCVPYVKGTCFSCGDQLEVVRFGRCRSCSLAWRLAAGVPIDALLAEAIDTARVA
jgi:hypothetical protein